MEKLDPKDYDTLTKLIVERELKPTSCCVDVGCHSGEILDMMLETAKDGNFYCFEPIPDLASGLRGKYPRPNVHIFEMALSDKIGSASFNYVTSNPGYSGILKRHYDRPHEADRKINVELNTLDNIMGSTQVDFIKIDVEGAELQVLRGAKQTIARDRPLIVFEHGLGAADCYETTPEMIIDLLVNELGMEIYGLHDFIEGHTHLERDSFCNQFYTGAHYYFLAK